MDNTNTTIPVDNTNTTIPVDNTNTTIPVDNTNTTTPMGNSNTNSTNTPTTPVDNTNSTNTNTNSTNGGRGQTRFDVKVENSGSFFSVIEFNNCYFRTGSCDYFTCESSNNPMRNTELTCALTSRNESNFSVNTSVYNANNNNDDDDDDNNHNDAEFNNYSSASVFTVSCLLTFVVVLAL